MKVTRNGSQASAKGPSDWFTGVVRIDQPFQAADPGRVAGAVVTFEPGARTAWHTHPVGQALHVLSGVGWAQLQGEAAQAIRPGDSVWIEAGEVHWHGAQAEHTMVHLAMQEKDEAGVNVVWGEMVTEAEYGAAGK